jgi:hypothetical protein
MKKKTEEKPRPDEPKPQRPMVPVMEEGPEPDPKLKAPRPETTDSQKQGEKLINAEQERIENAKKAKAAQG